MSIVQIGGLTAGGLAAAGRIGKPWHDNGNSGSAITIDWTAGAKQILTLTADPVTITFAGVVDGQDMDLKVINTAGAVLTFASVTEWSGGAQPLGSSGATDVDLYSFAGLPAGVYGQVTAWDVS